MSTPASAPAIGVPDRTRVYRPGPVRLVRVEMRKMVDTRSGFWLLLLIALGAGAGVVISIFAGPDSDRLFEGFFQVTLVPTALFLPVLGILMVTTEWSQRTAMATYSLVPNRLKVAVAKLIAAVAYALLSIVTSLLLAAAGYAVAISLGNVDAASWKLRWTVLGGAALFEVVVVVIGVAFGMLFMNSPLAIVLYFVLPQVFAILGNVIPRTREAFTWLDVSSASGPLVDAAMTRDDWQHLASSAGFWIVLPLVLGTVRLLRREVS